MDECGDGFVGGGVYSEPSVCLFREDNRIGLRDNLCRLSGPGTESTSNDKGYPRYQYFRYEHAGVDHAARINAGAMAGTALFGADLPGCHGFDRDHRGNVVYNSSRSAR